MRQDIIDRKEEILNWIEGNYSKSFICRELNCKADTLNNYLKKWGIEYSGNASGKGFPRENNGYLTAEEYIKNNNSIKSHTLKLKILRDGIKLHQCEKCKNTQWLENPIPLELHHKDGNHYNNEFDNLELLCPNCHALEDNNSGAANKKEEKKYYCECGREIAKNSNNCRSCSKKLQPRTVERPSKEILIELLTKYNFTQVGKQFGVSDNAIRKWCISYGISSSSKDYKNEGLL